MEWYPEYAMKAYLESLQPCRSHHTNELDASNGSTELVEPKCMEFLSALAAGKRARLMVEITSEGITPLTIALAVAAKHTGGRLVCINLAHQEDKRKINKPCLLGYDDDHDLEDVIEFVHGNPFEAVKQYKKVDFIVVDGKLLLNDEDRLKLSKNMHVNPSGCTIVGYNARYGFSFSKILNGNGRVIESVTLPIGEGMELTRLGSIAIAKRKNRKRFHVTFED